MKKKIQIFALAALTALGFMAAAVQPILAVGSSTGTGGIKGAVGSNSPAKGSNVPTDLNGNDGMITQIVNFLLFLIGVISVIMIIYGGIQYTLSSGDQGKITTAKNTILYAIVGLIVAIMAYAIVNFFVNQFATGN